MATSTAQHRVINFEKYLALPEAMQRDELIDGEMIMSPPPTARPQAVLGNLYRTLFHYVSGDGLVQFYSRRLMW